MKNQPIKRKKYLLELSRDHHFGLLCCWKIRQGLDKGIATERIKAYLNFFWNGHLKYHFEEEEQLIFNSCDDLLCQQAINEHQLIINQIAEVNLAAVNDDEPFEQLIKILNDHIRFEERVLFPHLEVILPLKILEAIETGLAKAQEETPFKDDFKDQFWA